MKNMIRNILISLNLDLTKNLKYDRLTRKVISAIVKPSSVCIDVGCHKGDILEEFLKHAPQGGHYCFEPIPELYEYLKTKYPNNNIFPYALSEKEGSSKFQYVKNAPAFSGLKKRKYNIAQPVIEELEITVKTLDSIIPDRVRVTLIKIDVEGGELGVLKGAKNLLIRDRPYVIFECGLGASDYYNTKPEDVFDFLSKETQMNLSLLDRWLTQKKPLTKDEFCTIFNNNSEYYFIAYPKLKTEQ